VAQAADVVGARSGSYVNRLRPPRDGMVCVFHIPWEGTLLTRASRWCTLAGITAALLGLAVAQASAATTFTRPGSISHYEAAGSW
jgi:hypothetical protein